ncbi:MAG: FMN-binding protein [Nostocoides sp.]
MTAVVVGLASAGVLTLSWVDGLRPPVAPVLAIGSALPRSGPTTSQTGSAAPVTTRPPTPTTSRSSRPPRPSVKPTSAAPPPTRTAPAVVPHVIDGPLVQTEYGNVQVAVDYTGRHITDVVALHLTDSSGTSVDISAAAAPQLRREALAAQSAHIDLVSGATFTSEAYVQSLQAALDAAHI